MSEGRFEIIDTGPGRRARLHLGLIRAAVVADQLLGGRGLGYVVPRLGRLFGKQDYVIGALRGGRLKLSMNDAYWVTPLMRDGIYEPEVDLVLRRTLHGDAAFVDCGANIGYWSVLAARIIGTRDRVVGVEASPLTAPLLRENARLNAGTFAAVEAAVWSETDELVEIAIDPERHSWSSADPQMASTLKETGFTSRMVETITIDDAVERFVQGDPRVVVVKIDIEGAEERAIRGATETLADDCLLIYEEHGRSGDVHATRLLLNEIGMRVFIISPDGAAHLVRAPEEVANLTSDRSLGYNLCAARFGTEAYRRLTSPPTEAKMRSDAPSVPRN